MKLEALPAAKGDCLILRHGQEGKEHLILVDGGPAGIYPQSLKPRLMAIRQERIEAGTITEDNRLFIDLVVISHIDDDHINGIKALLTDIANGQAPFKIGRIWHNSFRSLADADAGVVEQVAGHTERETADLAGAFIAASGHDDPATHDLGLILASVQQGYDILGLARRLGIPVNPEFEGRVIEAAGGPPIPVDGLEVTVVGPMASELAALRRDFSTWLKAHHAGETEPASLASFTDVSVPNLSSIVLLVEGEGQRFLLTGDARGDRMMMAVRSGGLLDAAGTMPVDVLKVPHHGSDRNITASFFGMFPASRYVISGNGEHGNPERDTLGFLAQACGGRQVTVELTYPPEEIDRQRAVEWNRRRGARPFDPATQGVVEFLAAQPNFAVTHPG